MAKGVESTLMKLPSAMRRALAQTRSTSIAATRASVTALELKR
jgi:hypothetical protein